jgi:acyl-CoA synthetase (AMP-forming)/AMP-acid ligase II
MKGYWNAPELTAETIRDGWLFTRDMGRIDEDGFLYLVDRKSDMIISGGFNVYPAEVENALYQHSGVFEVAVVGVPDAKWGETVKAVVVLKADAKASESELIEHCQTLLARFKAPTSVDFVSELPKSAVGKTLRRVIRETYWQGQERRIN